MAARNLRYRKPGPASTGLPVYGFADAISRIVIDITLTSATFPWGSHDGN